MEHCPYEAYRAEKPAYTVLCGHTRDYHRAHGRVAYRKQDILLPEGVDGNVRVREVQDQKQKAQSRQSQGEYPQRPAQPCGGAVAHPADSSSLFPVLSVTTLLYSTTVSKALRQTLRGSKAPYNRVRGLSAFCVR